MSLEKTKVELDKLYEEYEAKEQHILDQLSAEDRVKIGSPIKHIHHLDKFKANGKEYTIRTSLTITRFEEFEKLQVYVGYGVDFLNMFGNIKKAYSYMNNSKVADASVVLYNIMNGIKDQLEERENEVLMLCSLFITLPDEDLTVYDEELLKSKIDDWKKEGISMESFFTLAFSLVNGFMPVYQEVSQDISEHIAKVSEEVKSAKRKGRPRKSS